MKKVMFIMASTLLLAACGGGGRGYSSASSSSPMPTPTPTPAATDHAAFVKQQLTMTSETADPIDVSTTTFAFADDDNETAFDVVLPP